MNPEYGRLGYIPYHWAILKIQVWHGILPFTEDRLPGITLGGRGNSQDRKGCTRSKLLVAISLPPSLPQTPVTQHGSHAKAQFYKRAESVLQVSRAPERHFNHKALVPQASDPRTHMKTPAWRYYTLVIPV